MALGGPLLIVGAVVFAMRGFVFGSELTNQHPDILAFWLPHYCFLGQSLAAGHVPLWDPLQMAGMPYGADPQSGWLNLPAMGLFSTLSCGTALRMFIALQPLLAGLGLYWFLRMERLSRPAATAGGLSLGVAISASIIALSLPFSGSLAWTPIALVGASGYLRAERMTARLGWLAVGAFGWGQVAASHMSHGLAMATLLVVAYMAARSIRDVRAGEITPRRAALLAAGFLLFLPLANLAMFVPRVALLGHSSLRHGYAAVGGKVAGLAGISDQPLASAGVWSGWPFALGSAPGAYVGATVLLAVPLAFRTYGKRYLAAAAGVVAAASYLLTLSFLVGNGLFRAVVLHLPFGDVYLHNPGRLRYLAYLVVPILGALGIQGLIERPLARRAALWWLGAGLALWLLLPLALGAHPSRFLLLIAGAAAAIPALVALARGRRGAAISVVGVLTVELLASVVYSQAYSGGTVLLGLERSDRNLTAGPIHEPNVSVDTYLDRGPIARAMRGHSGRYLTWAPPAAYYDKGYLSTQGQEWWPALENGRGMLFGLGDALGYDPVQLTRYWSYIRATNGKAIFYNASVIRRPSRQDVELLGVRYLVAPRALPPPLPVRPVATEGRFVLDEVQGWEPRASVISRWDVRTSSTGALLEILQPRFDPSESATVQGYPGISQSGPAGGGSARYREAGPEDVRVDVTAPGPSIVLVRNAFDPNWSATVDGRPAKVLPTDYFLQGVPVPAGNHVVRLTYRDPSIGRGLLASVVVWVLWLLGLAWAVVRRRPGRVALAPPGPTLPPAPPPDGAGTPR